MTLPSVKSKAQAVESLVKEAGVYCLKLQGLNGPKATKELAEELRATLAAAVARAKTL